MFCQLVDDTALREEGASSDGWVFNMALCTVLPSISQGMYEPCVGDSHPALLTGWKRRGGGAPEGRGQLLKWLPRTRDCQSEIRASQSVRRTEHMSS